MWLCTQAVSNLKWVPSTLAEVNFGTTDEAAQQMTEVMQHNTEVKFIRQYSAGDPKRRPMAVPFKSDYMMNLFCSYIKNEAILSRVKL